MNSLKEVDRALTFKIWYERPDLFFQDIFGLKPYPYQADFMKIWRNPEEHKRVLIVAAGGTGKTLLLAGVALYYVTVIAQIRKEPKEVIILSGSLLQAKNVYKYIRNAISRNEFLQELVSEFRQSDTVFKDGSSIKALASSLTAVQGQHCFDEETEILTKDGWKKWNEISYSDLIATLKDGKYLTYEHPKKIWVYDYSGEMIHLKSRTVDLLVTPNHRMYIQSYTTKDGKPGLSDWHFVRADSLPFTSFHKRSCVWNGREEETIVIPGYSKHYYQHEDLILNMDDFVEFLGYFLSEGTFSWNPSRDGRRIEIGQTYSKQEPIVACLKRMGFKPIRLPDRVRFFSPQLHEYLYQLFKKGKYIPDFVKDLSSRQLRIFLKAYIYGDGWPTKNSYVISTSNPRLRDDLEEVILKAGYSFSETEIPSRKHFFPKNKKEYLLKKNWRIYILKRRRAIIQRKHISRLQYSGKVWCVTIPSGLILAKRKGKILWTGNSDMVIVDEAALVEDFLLDDCYRIIGAHDGIMIWSGTPTVYESKFVRIFEEEESKQKKGEETLWEIWTWSAKDCPRLRSQMEEARNRLPEDMWRIFWEGRPYPLTGTLIPRDAMIEATRGITRFKRRDDWKVIIGVDWGWCISGDTEILTDSGWKKPIHLREGDLVYTLNLQTMEGEYQPFFNLRIRPFEGYMIHLSSRNLDLLAKWDHALVFYDRNFKRPHLHEFGERVTHDKLPRFAPLKGPKPKYFILPGIESRRTDLDFGPKKLPMIPFLRVLGWYLTEGSPYKKGIIITQKNPKYQELIMKDINDLGFHCWKSGEKSIYVSSIQLKAYFSQFGKSKEKFIPQEIKNLDASLLRELIDRMMKGDGDKDGYRFNTFSRQLAEDFAEIVCKSGIGYAIVKDRGEKGYRVDILRRHSSPLKRHYKRVYWKGLIWALETPNKTIYVRRNGKPAFIHNADPTAIVIVQTDGTKYEVLEAHMFKETDFDLILDFVESKAKQYSVHRIFVDAEDKGENLRLRKRGLPVFEVAFNKEKAMLQARLRDLFVKNRVKIPDEDLDNFQDLIYQLRTYTWTKKSGEDLVDALMLALKEFEPKEITQIYIAKGRTRRKKRYPKLF